VLVDVGFYLLDLDIELLYLVVFLLSLSDCKLFLLFLVFFLFVVACYECQQCAVIIV